MVRQAALIVSLLWSASVFAQTAQPPQGSSDAGRDAFMKVGCWTCHGTEGQGAAATGPRIANTALPFDAFLQQLRHPANQMVPVPTSIVSDKQAADIYAYLHTIKKDDWKSIPLLQH
jgi:mono/diheme cytochrome c family protein